MIKIRFFAFFLLLAFSVSVFACEALCVALIASLGIHAAIAAITFDQNGRVTVSQGNSAESGQALIVTLSPKKESAVPAGWQAASNPTSSPVPPLLVSSPAGSSGYIMGGYFGNTPYEACSGGCAQFNSTAKIQPDFDVNGAYLCSVASASRTSCIYSWKHSKSGATAANTGGTIPDSFYSSVPAGTCPYTYTSDGAGGCKSTSKTVADALYPVGAPQTVAFHGSSPVRDSKVVDPLPPFVSQPDANTMVINSTDGSGEQTKIAYDSATKKTTVTISKPSASVSGSTSATTDKTTLVLSPPDASGNTYVEGVNRQTIEGQGTAQTGNVVNPGGGFGQTGSGSSEFPDDYARRGEAATAADRIRDGQCGRPGQPECNINDSGFEDKDAEGESAFNDAVLAETLFNNTLGNVVRSAPDVGYSWVPSFLPGEPVSCQPIPLNISFSSGLLSGIHGQGSIEICDKIGLARSILGYMVFVFTAFYIFRVFTRSDKGA